MGKVGLNVKCDCKTVGCRVRLIQQQLLRGFCVADNLFVEQSFILSHVPKVNICSILMIFRELACTD